MQTVLQDLRYAIRQLSRSPGYTVTTVLTLALSIGATTAMYSIVRSTLLSPLPYAHPEELVGIGFSQAGDPPDDNQTGEAGDLLQSQATSFASAGMADGGPLGANFSTGNGNPRNIQTLRVSASYLPTLGVAPILGHTFTREEDLPGAAPTVILSESLWRNLLNADPQVVGKTIHLNEDAYTVVGVLPSSFATVDSPDVWQPLHLSSADPGYQGTNYQMIARLKPGISMQRAAAEIDALNAAVYRRFPWYTRWNPPGAPRMQESLWPLQQIVVSAARPSLLAVSAAVFAVLLLACLNLAGLATARSIGRISEIAIRNALGASFSSTLRLVLTECLVLALAGSLLGLGLATAAVPLLLATSPVAIPQLHAARSDLGVTLFAIVAGCATAIVFGLLPAFVVLRRAGGLHLGNARTSSATAGHQKLSKSLLVAQVAMATTMLSAGALFLSAFLNMRAIPSGIRPEHLYALQVNLKGDAYSSAAHTQQFIAAVEDRLRQIPGVGAVATINGLPLDRALNASAGPAAHKDQVRNSEVRLISPGYLRTAGLNLLAGNDFSAADTSTAAPVALINELAAQRWFPGRNPVGEFIVALDRAPRRVIGVTANVHGTSLADSARPMVLLPFSQASDDAIKTVNGWFPTTFVLRMAGHQGAPDPSIERAASAAVTAVDPEIPAATFAPVQTFVDASVAAPRFFSWLAAGFALFAVLLTAIGLFGLLSYQVTSRTRELGVRMALGAQRRQLLTLVIKNGLLLTCAGLALGAIGSVTIRGAVTSLLSSTIGSSPTRIASLLGHEAFAIVVAAATMLLVTLFASLIPARRAAHLEPIEALRNE
jgi:predicted permease